MINPTFRNIKRLFLFSFKNADNNPERGSYDKYYMPSLEIKDFNALIEKKPFFDQPVKKKQEAYENIVEMSRNDDYATGNPLHFPYHQNYYKLVSKDLSRQTNTSIPEQINFTGKLEEDNGAIKFFIAEKQQKIILNFSLDSLIIIE